MSACSSHISAHKQVLWFFKLGGTDRKLQRNESRGGGTLKSHHPTDDTGTAQLYWDAAQTSTNSNHRPGCELGMGCQTHKSNTKALQKNDWNNLSNYPEMKVGGPLFAGGWVRETEVESMEGCKWNQRKRGSREYWSQHSVLSRGPRKVNISEWIN